MPLTPCRECGAAVSPHAHACPRCGARLAPVSPAAFASLPPRPPAEPEGRGWLTIAGWVVLLAVGALVALFVFRASTAADQRATEQAEVAREREHLVAVSAWVQDTSASAPLPDSAGRPAPTSQRAKRMWVVSRMLVDYTAWKREVMTRHGFNEHRPPAAWGTPGYQANARSYPQVGRYLEGRVAAITELEKTSAAWMDEHVAGLARESGLTTAEIREIFPPDFVRPAPGEARLSEALLELHRHLVRIDPRVRPAGGNQLSFEREDDVRRLQELEARLNDAHASVQRARAIKTAAEVSVLSRAIE